MAESDPLMEQKDALNQYWLLLSIFVCLFTMGILEFIFDQYGLPGRVKSMLSVFLFWAFIILGLAIIINLGTNFGVAAAVLTTATKIIYYVTYVPLMFIKAIIIVIDSIFMCLASIIKIYIGTVIQAVSVLWNATLGKLPAAPCAMLRCFIAYLLNDLITSPILRLLEWVLISIPTTMINGFLTVLANLGNIVINGLPSFGIVSFGAVVHFPKLAWMFQEKITDDGHVSTGPISLATCLGMAICLAALVQIWRLPRFRIPLPRLHLIYLKMRDLIFYGRMAAPATQPHNQMADPQTDKFECIVCFDRQRRVVVNPCHHFCMCQECANGVDECPMCRGPIETTTLVFAS